MHNKIRGEWHQLGVVAHNNAAEGCLPIFKIWCLWQWSKYGPNWDLRVQDTYLGDDIIAAYAAALTGTRHN
jgi:hypothetical protein